MADQPGTWVRFTDSNGNSGKRRIGKAGTVFQTVYDATGTNQAPSTPVKVWGTTIAHIPKTQVPGPPAPGKEEVPLMHPPKQEQEDKKGSGVFSWDPNKPQEKWVPGAKSNDKQSGATSLSLRPGKLVSAVKPKASGLTPVVYHGSPRSFTDFDQKIASQLDRGGGNATNAIFFTDNPHMASSYAYNNSSWGGGDPVSEGQVRMARLHLKNPYISSDGRYTGLISQKEIDALKAQGYDGIIENKGYGGREYIVFDKSQVHSPWATSSSVQETTGQTRPKPTQPKVKTGQVDDWGIGDWEGDFKKPKPGQVVSGTTDVAKPAVSKAATLAAKLKGAGVSLKDTVLTSKAGGALAEAAPYLGKALKVAGPVGIIAGTVAELAPVWGGRTYNEPVTLPDGSRIVQKDGKWVDLPKSTGTIAGGYVLQAIDKKTGKLIYQGKDGSLKIVDLNAQSSQDMTKTISADGLKNEKLAGADTFFFDKDGKKHIAQLSFSSNGKVQLKGPGGNQTYRTFNSREEADAWLKIHQSSDSFNGEGQKKVATTDGNWRTDGTGAKSRPLYTNGKQTGYQVKKDGKVNTHGTGEPEVSTGGPVSEHREGFMPETSSTKPKPTKPKASKPAVANSMKVDDWWNDKPASKPSTKPTAKPAKQTPRVVDDWWRDKLGRQPEKPKATTKPTSPLGSIQAGPTGAYEHGRGQPPGTVVTPSATEKLDPAIQAAMSSRSAETKAARDPSKPAWHQNENWVASPDQGTAAIARLNLPSAITVLETRPGKEGRVIYRLNNGSYVAMDPTDPNATPQYAGWWKKDEWESSQHGTVVPPAAAGDNLAGGAGGSDEGSPAVAENGMVDTPEGKKTPEQIDREVDIAMRKAGINPPVDPTAPAAQLPNVPEPVIPPEVAPAAPTSGVAVTSGQPGGPVSTYEYDKPANVPAWQTKIDPELGGIGGNDISKHGQALAVRDSKDGTKLIVQMSDGSFQSVDKSTGTVAGAGTWGNSKGGDTSVAGISNPTPATPAASPSNSSLVITSPLPPQPETPVVSLGVTDPTQATSSQNPLISPPAATPTDAFSGLSPPQPETLGIFKHGRWLEM